MMVKRPPFNEANSAISRFIEFNLEPLDSVPLFKRFNWVIKNKLKTPVYSHIFIIATNERTF